MQQPVDGPGLLELSGQRGSSKSPAAPRMASTGHAARSAVALRLPPLQAATSPAAQQQLARRGGRDMLGDDQRSPRGKAPQRAQRGLGTAAAAASARRRAGGWPGASSERGA
jgi:hypothetical protein